MPQPTTNSDSADQEIRRSAYARPAEHDRDHIDAAHERSDEFVEYSDDEDDEEVMSDCADSYEDYEPVRSIPDIVTDSDFEGAIRSLPSTLTLTPASPPAVTQWNTWNNDEEDVTRSIDVARMNDDTEFFGTAAPVWVASYGQSNELDADEPLPANSLAHIVSTASIRQAFDAKPNRQDNQDEPGAAFSANGFNQARTSAQSNQRSALTATASTQTPSSLNTAAAYSDVDSSSPRQHPLLCRTHSVVLDDDDESRAFRSRQYASRASMNEEYTQARRTVQQLIDNALAQHQLAAAAAATH